MKENGNKFLSLLMERIVESHQIPKVQVERVVSPILSMFVADALTKKFANNDSLRGKYELVCMEFPLKKPENSQSTNIDFLLVNTTTLSIVFLEIKTDSRSIDRNQLEIYLKLRDEVKEFGGGFLLRNLSEIAGRSARGNKYLFLQNMIAPYKRTIIDSSELKIIYLVPKVLKSRLVAENNIDAVFSFMDLPDNIDGDLAEEWCIIKESLVKLESMEVEPELYHTPVSTNIFSQNTGFQTLSQRIPDERMEVRIRRQIEDYCQRNLPPGVVPKYVQLGNTGEGGSPNYQVVFSNHKVVPFYNLGKLFTRASSFKSANLKPLVLWERFGI